MDAGRAALERALRATARNTGCVGGGMIALGIFVAAVHGLRLDASVDDVPTLGVLVLYAVGATFAGAGAWLVRAALVRHRARGKELLRVLDDEPERIERVWESIVPDEEAQRGPPAVHVRLRDGDEHVVLLPAAAVTSVVDYLRRRAPAAASEGPEQSEAGGA
jgi:hypothetical protein